MPRPECALSSVVSGEGYSWARSKITSHFLSVQERKGYNGDHSKEDSTVTRSQGDICLSETSPGFFVCLFFWKSHPIYFKAKVGESTGSLSIENFCFVFLLLLKLLLLLICPDISQFVQHKIGNELKFVHSFSFDVHRLHLGITSEKKIG